MQNRLREVRQMQGIPFNGLAAKAKISTATLGMIERFDYMPGVAIKERLAAVLNVSIGSIWPEAKANMDTAQGISKSREAPNG